MIIAPKGAGWTVITCTEKTFSIISQLMGNGEFETMNERRRNDIQWASLRKKVQQNARLGREFR